MAEPQFDFTGIPESFDFTGINAAKSAETKPSSPDEVRRQRIARLEELERTYNPDYQLGEAVKGAARGAVSTIQGLASPIRKAFGMAPATPPPDETTRAGKVGRVVEQGAEFFAPESLAGGVVGALPKVAKAARVGTKAVLTAAGTYGLARAQGDTSPGVAAGLGAVGPILEGAGPLTYRWLRRSARSGLEKMFGSSALEPMAVRRAIKDLVPVALEEGIPATWQKWALQAERGQAAKGQAVQETVAGPAGDTWVSLRPVRDALDELINSAQLFLTKPAGKGHLVSEAVMTKNEALLRQAKLFKTKVDQIAATHVPARALHEVKSSWNELAKYAGDENPKTIRDLVITEKARAARTATKAIREVLEDQAPDIAKVDQAYHIAKDLHRYVVETALESSGKVGKQVATSLGGKLRRATALGISTGTATGAYAGYRQEGVPGAIGGAVVGGVTGRLLEQALHSPAFAAAGPKVKDALATAIVSGNAERIRRLVSPFIAEAAASTP